MPQGRAAPTVLVVEDDGVIRMVLAAELEDRGFAVVEAGTTHAALAALAEGPAVAAVVTDVRVPGPVDGLGLARWMAERAADVPVVVTSGYAVRDRDVAGVNPAIARVIAKPYDPRDVAEAVAELLRRAPAGPVAGTQGGA
jgi:DNA-binding NtrC family response regulator